MFPLFPKQLQLKAFSKVNLLPLTLSHHTLFSNFEKILVLLLYWFAAQQQTSTFRCEIFDPFSSKFQAELMSLFPATKRGSKIAKPKLRFKNITCTSFGV